MTAALAEAERGLQCVGDSSNDELRWRLSAIATLALRALGETDRARELRALADKALVRLRSDWPNGLDTYEKRPDLAELITRLGPA